MSWQRIGQEALVATKRRLTLVFGFVAVLWAVEIVDFLLLGSLDGLGIRPRTTFGLIGIPLAPFLHGGFSHLFANTTALIPLGFLVSARRLSHLPFVTIFVTVVGGLCVWLFARSSVHIGASGVVFGYLGFLLLVGFFERSFAGIALSLAVGVMYGGLFFGVLPGQPGISWESHLFGFLAGALAARLVARRGALPS